MSSTKQHIEVRRMHRFIVVPDTLVDDQVLSNTSKILYMHLARFADKAGECYPSIRTLASRMGVSTRTVQQALKELEARDYLQKISRIQKSNLYILKDGRESQGCGSQNHTKEGGVVPRTTGCGSQNHGSIPNEEDTLFLSNDKNNGYSVTTPQEKPVDNSKTDPGAKPKSDYQIAVGKLFELHKDAHEEKYVFAGEDGRHIQDLLDRIGLAVFLIKIELYYRREWWFTKKSGHTVRDFRRHINELVDSSSRSPPAEKRCPDCGEQYVGSFCHSCGWGV